MSAPLLCLRTCRYDFVIVSYDMLKDVSEVLTALNFKVVILDESHCIKNPGVRTQGSKNIERQATADSKMS